LPDGAITEPYSREEWEAAKEKLRHKLSASRIEDRIEANGNKAEGGQREAIPALFWIDALIDDLRSQAFTPRPADSGLPSESGWISVKIGKAALLAAFQVRPSNPIVAAAAVNGEMLESLAAMGLHLSLGELSRRWSEVSKRVPHDLVGEMIKAFWLGTFERSGKSALFSIGPGDNVVWGGTSDGMWLMKTDKEDRVPALASELMAHPMGRRSVAQILNNSALIPWPWDGSEDGLVRYANTPYLNWPDDIRRLHFEAWCIRHDDFLPWYEASGIWPKIPLADFWPADDCGAPPQSASKQNSVEPTSSAASSRVRWMDAVHWIAYRKDFAAPADKRHITQKLSAELLDAEQRLVDALRDGQLAADGHRLNPPAADPSMKIEPTFWKGARKYPKEQGWGTGGLVDRHPGTLFVEIELRGADLLRRWSEKGLNLGEALVRLSDRKLWAKYARYHDRYEELMRRQSDRVAWTRFLHGPFPKVGRDSPVQLRRNRVEENIRHQLDSKQLVAELTNWRGGRVPDLPPDAWSKATINWQESSAWPVGSSERLSVKVYQRGAHAVERETPVRASEAQRRIAHCERWLRESSQSGQLRKTLSVSAPSVVPGLRTREFDAAYKAVYGHGRGRPRQQKSANKIQ